MILNIITDFLRQPIIILTIILLIIIVTVSFRTLRELNKKDKTKISFKEAMELTELPVITFYNNDQKINFLLDTGSNDSHITRSALKFLEYTMLDDRKPITTMGVSNLMTTCCNITISNKNHTFEGTFVISDLDEAFNIIKKESGVQIHGILGSKFFQEYKYVLDFDELIAYLK